MLRIDASALDHLITELYLATVLGVGVLARRLTTSDLDGSVRAPEASIDAWRTGAQRRSALPSNWKTFPSTGDGAFEQGRNHGRDR
jgi:hypothetical protein